MDVGFHFLDYIMLRRHRYAVLTENIQDQIYKKRLEKIELRGGKSREESIKKANTKLYKK